MARAPRRVPAGGGDDQEGAPGETRRGARGHLRDGARALDRRDARDHGYVGQSSCGGVGTRVGAGPPR